MEKNKEATKCKVVDGKIKPCKFLNKAIELGVKKGFVIRETLDLEKHKIKDSFVGYKGGEYGKNGVVINFCPFCGEEISKHILQEAK
jgi:hypothetical protein